MQISTLTTLQVALILVLALISSITQAQFLFTYEINQEDDSRAPKSSLFDPSAFKIVTPSQLQSSYQKISSQLESQVAATAASVVPPAAVSQASSLAGLGESVSSLGNGPETSGSAVVPPQPAPGLLKQTSAALQSLAELFSFGSPQSSASTPSPITPTLANLQPSIDQQAEARSLHEHWTQQQQNQHQPQAHHQQTSPVSSSPALQSFTTNTPVSNLLHHHQQSQQSSQANQAPQASYWLTANPLNAPDGNFLVEIKQPQSQQQQQQQSQPEVSSSSSGQLVDNLLALGHRSLQQPQSQLPRLPTNNLRQSAQSSFLSTPPTSYYPHPHQPQQTTELNSIGGHQSHHHAFGGPVTQPSVGRPANPAFQLPAINHQHHIHQHNRHQHNQQLLSPPSSLQNLREIPESAQLQQPANAPENFNPSLVSQAPLQNHQQPALHHTTPLHHHQARSQPVQQPIHAHLKSAEESLAAFRQQQQQHSASISSSQHVQRAPQQPAQQVYAEPANRSPHTPPTPVATPVNPAPSAVAVSNGEIPKVSPQIYESFLLQQRDQHEKHMELLKAQQELNKLMEQKQKQQEAAQDQARRRKKKEEAAALADKEAKKKALREQELARKLRLEQELEAKRKREEEAENRKRQAAEAEARRYREYLERERIERERVEQERKRERELAEQQQRRREMEERELKLRMERELAERRRLEAERAAAEEAEREKRKRDEEAKYANYLRQQEELRKLLELKQKEDEAQQARRQQAGQQQQQQQQSQSAQQSQPQQSVRSQSNRANRLAQEHRERSQTASVRNSGSWGTPLRTRGSSTSASTTTTTTTTETPFESSGVALGATAQASTSEPSLPARSTTSSPPQATRSRSQQIAAANRRQRAQASDEKLIRQKIPLYSGAGKYGLYRNESLSQDLAALLASVTLPPSTTTSTTTSTTQSPADSVSSTQESTGERRFVSGPVTPSNFALDGGSISSSLSPLLNQANSGPVERLSGGEPSFDDDVPRRPARGLTRLPHQSSTSTPTTTTTTTTLPTSTRQTTVAPRRVHSQRFQNETGSSGRSAHIGLASLPPDADNDGIPGRAGVEYPVLSAVPPTSFSCSKQPLNGYYADTETACQVVHLCQGGVQSSILCPNGTIFNQEKFSCQWWYEVNCSRAPIFYQLNDNLYKASDLFETGAMTDLKKTTKKEKEKSSRTNLLSSS